MGGKTMSRISLKIVRSFIGSCIIITDNETSKSVEVMSAQLQAVINTNRTNGSFPHGGWDKDNDLITIYHDEDRILHEVSFTAEEIINELN